MEYWQIELWENQDGIRRVERDLLKKMMKKEKFLFADLIEKMEQYTKVNISDVQKLERLEKVKSEDNMWELKFHLSKNEIRFLGCLTLENGLHVFYALYAFKKKNQKIINEHRIVARGRVKEFINYFNPNELKKIL
ncbi:MAG: hypothetical protein QG566_367 [Patescibacteria group bacterium]|jgi:hypothetical protein|nr:hypothetical protein [Patescibacteria group bacterium]